MLVGTVNGSSASLSVGYRRPRGGVIHAGSTFSIASQLVEIGRPVLGRSGVFLGPKLDVVPNLSFE